MKNIFKSKRLQRISKTLMLVTALTGTLGAGQALAETKSAYFAGGCFWCIEKDFEQVDGVIEVESGYQGGENTNPTYQNHPGHLEVVRIDYDTTKVDYATLLQIFFRSIDPTDAGGQFCDRGLQYSTAIFTSDPTEIGLAEAAKAQAGSDLNKDIATVIRNYEMFYKSEEYHQNYYQKNPIRYSFYRQSCGRDRTVKKLWGDQAYFGIKK